MEITLEYIQDLIPQARKYSGYLSTKCLFHPDNTPSMMIYADGFFCYSCGKRGTLEQLVQYIETGKIRPPKTVLPYGGLIWSIDNSEEICQVAHQFLKENSCYMKYLVKRKIDSIAISLHIGYINGFYTFPIYNERNIFQGAVARASDYKQKQTNIRYILPKGQKPLLYVPDWERVNTATRLFLPFGIIDNLTLYQIGYPSIGVSSGKSINPELIKRFNKQIIILPDEGEGKDGWKLASELSWRAKVKNLNFPFGCKDINDIYMKYGKEKIIELLEE